MASLFAIMLGVFIGWLVGWMFEKGHVPEFLKSPIVFSLVILCFTIADEVTHETGLLAVTTMGITLANMKLSSIEDMRHFKENISILLISTIFVMLTASLSLDTLINVLNINIIGFVLLMMFAVRPLSIWLSTIGTDLTWKEKTLIGWIAPRGIVALTVASYFVSLLSEEGYGDAERLMPLTFALVFATVCAHGFSLRLVAHKLDLAVESKPGVLIVGSNEFTIELAKTFEQQNIHVLLVDSSWERLSLARNQGIPFYHGEILAEQTEYSLDMTPYEYMVCATELDSYNALVCTNFVPTIGRNNLYQISLNQHQSEDVGELVHTIGGRILFEPPTCLYDLRKLVNSGYVLRKTKLSEQFTFHDYLTNRDDTSILLYIVKSTGEIRFFTTDYDQSGEAGDVVVTLMAPSKEFRKIKEKVDEQNNNRE
ncbi:hypothetical protein Q75_16910 [Bacillus coahuilensis p1.1.43]|uniref:Uncharacterized protein n=2 Tax=Bacillus coahuilensis TaxID=408580 RepID=A0A147K3X4_9BACI|nr:hypothetical protein Q75_16910 [Bacillus coahuilensis p1.1.43]